MSYAIAPTFEANKIGVRRVYTLGMFRGLDGAPSALALQMISDGYDISTITTLADNNVTDAQLQYLYDNFGAGTPEFASAANAILQQITSASGAVPSSSGAVSPGTSQTPMQTSAAGAVYGAVSTVVQNPFGGDLDLTLEASWNAISGYFTTVQQAWNSAVQAQGGKPDADTINQVANFNQLVAEWAGYYQKAMGSAPSPVPMVSVTGLSGTLGVVPVALVLGIAGIAAVAALLATLFISYQNAITKRAQITANAATQQAANTAATQLASTTSTNLLTQANALTTQATTPGITAAQSQALLAQAAQLRAQAGAVTTSAITATTAVAPSSTSALSTWFTQNWVGVAAVILGIAVLPGLVKKL